MITSPRSWNDRSLIDITRSPSLTHITDDLFRLLKSPKWRRWERRGATSPLSGIQLSRLEFRRLDGEILNKYRPRTNEGIRRKSSSPRSGIIKLSKVHRDVYTGCLECLKCSTNRVLHVHRENSSLGSLCPSCFRFSLWQIDYFRSNIVMFHHRLNHDVSCYLKKIKFHSQAKFCFVGYTVVWLEKAVIPKYIVFFCFLWNKRDMSKCECCVA